MAAKLDDLLPAIAAGKDAGLSLGAIRARFAGKAKAAAAGRAAELDGKLTALAENGAIWGPLRHGAAQYYFASGFGPSIETAGATLEHLVLRSGVKLLSRAALEKKLTGKHRRFFADGIKHAVASRALVELACGPSKYYLHRDVATERLGFHVAPPNDEAAETAEEPAERDLTFEDLLPVYRRLKAEQGGFSAVTILAVAEALGCQKEALHRLLVAEAKAGRLTIHHATSVQLAPEVTDSAIRLPGFAEPFVTVVVKDDR